MRNLNKLMLAIFFLVSMVSISKAEQSATGYGNPTNWRDQQVFVVAYNNSGSSLSRDNTVILDTTPSINANTNLGAYVTTNGATTDSVFVFGVTDETITNGTLGRICVRGPHKVVEPSPPVGGTGDVIGACASNSKACLVTTSSGTKRGFLGKLMSGTATTDTGDASNTFWAWIEPGVAN